MNENGVSFWWIVFSDLWFKEDDETFWGEATQDQAEIEWPEIFYTWINCKRGRIIRKKRFSARPTQKPIDSILTQNAFFMTTASVQGGQAARRKKIRNEDEGRERCWYSRQKAVSVHSFGRGRGAGLLVLFGYVVHGSKKLCFRHTDLYIWRTLSFLNIYDEKKEQQSILSDEKKHARIICDFSILLRGA